MGKRNKSKRHASPSSLIAWIKSLEKGLLALLVFLVPLTIYYGNTTYNQPKMILFVIGLAILYCLWAMRHLFERESSLRLPKLLWASLGLLGTLGLSLISATNLQIGLQNIVILSSFILFYFYLVNHIKQPTEIYGFLLMGIIASAIAAGYGWFQHEDLLPGNPKNPNAGVASMLSSFGNLNFLAEYLGIWVLPGILLAFKMKFFLTRILIAASLAGVIFIMLATSTLGVLISLVVGAFVIVLVAALLKMFKLPKRENMALIMVLMFSTLLTGGWMMQSDTSTLPATEPSQLKLLQFPWDSLQQFAERYEEATSVSARLLDWTLAVKMLLDKPLWGVGTGHYGIEFYNYKEQLAQTPLGGAFDYYIPPNNHVHNDYLEFIAETGLVGTAALITFFVVLVWGFVVQLLSETNRRKRWLILMLQVAILVICLDAVVNFPLHLPASGLGFVLLLGALDSAYLNRRIKPQQLSPISIKVFSGARVSMAVAIITLAMFDWQSDLHFERGNQLVQNELYQLAFGEFEKSLALDIAPTEVFYRLAGLYFESEDYDRAEEFYVRSLGTFLDESTYWNLAVVKLEQHELGAAKAYADFFERIRPSDRFLERLVGLRQVIEELETSE